MATWWYASNGERIGPKSSAEIIDLRANGLIDDATPVWRDGWAEWKTINLVPELALHMPPPLNDSAPHLPPPLPVVPPPLPDAPRIPQTSSEDILAYPMATRWPRFFARLFDIYLLVLPISFAAGYVLASIFSGFVRWITEPGAALWFGVLMLPLVLMVEALVHQWFGASPGKALLGLRVTNLRGESLSFEQYLRRNLALWSSGLAFGLPLICLITYANQSGRLGRGLQTSYDEKLGTRVYAKPIGWLRTTFAAVGVVVLLVVNTSLSKL